MVENIFTTIIEISIASSFAIAILLLVTPFIKKAYAAKWRYIIWLILAVRLIVPFNLNLPAPPVNLTAPSDIVLFGQPTIVTNANQPSQIMEPQIQAQILPEQSYVYSLLEVLSRIWLLGVAVFIIRLSAIYLFFSKKMKRQSEPVTDDRIITLFDRLCFELHINKKPRIWLCKNSCSPMVHGFAKPVLFLPDGEYEDFDLEVILRHELVHHKRHDLWYKLTLLFANAVHWFNPLVYLMIKSAYEDIEFSCDDEVTKNSDIDFRKRYSQAILNSMNKEHCQNVILSTQFKGGKKVMKNRFSNILSTAKKRQGTVALCAAAVLILSGGLFVACNQAVESELEKNLKLLKAGDTKPLVGFAIGDPIDYGLVDETDEYYGGGKIHKLKADEYKDIFLFFGAYPEKEFTGLGAEMTGNFFGLILGETNLQEVTDILGQPDVYEEESDMWNMPLAIYYFDKNTLFLNTDSEYKINRITYNDLVVKDESNGDSVNEVQNETQTETQQGILYVNERLGFSVEFPKNMMDKFGISENYVEWDERGGAGITVYHKTSRETLPDIGGAVFFIRRWIGTYTEEVPPLYAGTHTVVLQTDKYTYMLETPSGVEYIEDTETYAECEWLFDQFDTIITSVKGVNTLYSEPNAGYQTEAEFLSSQEGMQFRKTAYGATKALLKADADKLAEYMLDPNEAQSTVRNLTDVFDNLVLLQFKFILSSFRTDDIIITSYEYALIGDDSYTYVSMELNKVDGEWKVAWIGLEK